jgi:hypothetical protein
MIDPIQIVLTVVITILTILLVVIGIEVFGILKDLKKTLQRTNKILDDVEVITSTVSQPIEKFSGVISGIQQGVGLVQFVSHVLEKKSKKHASQDK